MNNKIELTKEECDIVYNQLSARLIDFEVMMQEASRKNNTRRIVEIAEVVETIKSVMNKLLGV